MLRVNRVIIGTAIIGILLSMYALYVEMAAEARPDYKALCDISEAASCTRVLTSEYAKGFGIIPKDSILRIPNCIYGIIFYCILIFLATYDNMRIGRLFMLLTTTSLLTSIYLAYLLAVVLKDICLVCISTYFVNLFLTVLSYKKIKILSSKLKRN